MDWGASQLLKGRYLALLRHKQMGVLEKGRACARDRGL